MNILDNISDNMSDNTVLITSLAVVAILIIVLTILFSNSEHFMGNAVFTQLYAKGPMDRYLTTDIDGTVPQSLDMYPEFLWNNNTRYPLFPNYWYYHRYFDPYAYIM